MKHFSDSFKGSGMTFVDLVFPLSSSSSACPSPSPSARLSHDPIWKILAHILLRTSPWSSESSWSIQSS
jgi:hypothetical protein